MNAIKKAAHRIVKIADLIENPCGVGDVLPGLGVVTETNLDIAISLQRRKLAFGVDRYLKKAWAELPQDVREVLKMEVGMIRLERAIERLKQK